MLRSRIIYLYTKVQKSISGCYFIQHDFEAIVQNCIAQIIALPSTLKGEFSHKMFAIFNHL